MSGTVRTPSAHLHPERRKAIVRILWVALAAVFCAGLLQAGQTNPNKHEARHEIFDLEDAWRTAVLKSDINAMSALLADDYMAITANGMLQTKQEALANLKARRIRFTKLLLSDRKVRFYGNTALVTSRAEVLGAGPEGDISGDFRYTRVYVRDGLGKWKIVSFESSRIHQPGEHKR